MLGHVKAGQDQQIEAKFIFYNFPMIIRNFPRKITLTLTLEKDSERKKTLVCPNFFTVIWELGLGFCKFDILGEPGFNL